MLSNILSARGALSFTRMALLLSLGACVFGGGPLIVRVEESGASVDGELYDELELDQALLRAFEGGGVREVILEAGPEVSPDYLASLMDRIHRLSRSAGLDGDCTVEARALPGAKPMAAAPPPDQQP